jgi:hypothetical protein
VNNINDLYRENAQKRFEARCYSLITQIEKIAECSKPLKNHIKHGVTDKTTIKNPVSELRKQLKTLGKELTLFQNYIGYFKNQNTPLNNKGL